MFPQMYSDHTGIVLYCEYGSFSSTAAGGCVFSSVPHSKEPSPAELLHGGPTPG